MKEQKMEQINWAKELRKRGFKLTPLPPLTPEQMKQIQETNEHVVNFLKKIEEAHKASEKSTLRFATSTSVVGQHSPRRFLFLNTQKQR